MTHSESISLVPALAAQLPPLPWLTEGFRTKVPFCVALSTPATAKPDPGSAPKLPNTSTVNVSAPDNWNNAKVSSPLLRYW